ncbi:MULTISPECIES: LysR family transcriptional regulator [Pelosinus]|uniref:LysR substrate-binding protein n=1 Tax=Pelosinus fermentans B4 TaxID=1149862 RepID=I9L5N8_9FIRM|nr:MULTISPECIES: LysR family transcriptional regulator [Pelosinus]EIW15536.1 LysR substrate-binding protein [Pelosinus fermentans B4]EIW26774.1 transcriptional regulator, LysR family [Pelosinus fermentans A11]OAM92280.1 transcriptional regulator, LysR family [Pelosinus fermentans DSM 17108]SDQ39441.1 DNA-binding transcriptional regulator, LysR family [Pelosinus fermentans]
MDLRGLKTFLTIVKLGSFQQAAQELRYAQSTVTMQIQKLERDLGVTLFERGKSFRLTEAGRICSEQSAHILRDVDQLQSTMSDITLGESGSILIGAIEPAASYRLPNILAAFMECHPKVQISIQIGNTCTLTELTLKGEIDFAISSVPSTSSGLTFEPLFSEPLVLLVPSMNPLAVKQDITIQDLKGERFLVTSRECVFRKKLSILLQKIGTSYSTLEINSLAALKYYVQANHGIALVPAATVTPAPAGTAVKIVQDLNLDLEVGFLRSSERSTFGVAEEKLFTFLRKSLCVL